MPGSHIRADRPESAEQTVALPDIIRVYPIDTAILATPPASSPTLPASLQQEPATYHYRVGAGDVLNIIVWGHPELTIPAGGERSAAESGNWVHADGSIFYPYVGRLTVAGMTVASIREEITRRLSRYIEDPQVEVSVAAFRSQRVYLTGALNEPGPQPISNVPMRLLDAFSAAGDLAIEADWQRVILTRNGEEYRLPVADLYRHGDTRLNILLQDGDVIHVARLDDSKVFVLGEVKQPRTVMMGRNGLTLAGTLAEAGGINQISADARGIFVLRAGEENGEGRVDVFQLNARDATALVLADHFYMQPRDIVYVTAAPVARWNRIIVNLAPTMNSLFLGARVDNEFSE